MDHNTLALLARDLSTMSAVLGCKKAKGAFQDIAAHIGRGWGRPSKAQAAAMLFQALQETIEEYADGLRDAAAH